eukprot:gene5076-5317_t
MHLPFRIDSSGSNDPFCAEAGFSLPNTRWNFAAYNLIPGAGSWSAGCGEPPIYFTAQFRVTAISTVQVTFQARVDGAVCGPPPAPITSAPGGTVITVNCTRQDSSQPSPGRKLLVLLATYTGNPPCSGGSVVSPPAAVDAPFPAQVTVTPFPPPSSSCSGTTVLSGRFQYKALNIPTNGATSFSVTVDGQPCVPPPGESEGAIVAGVPSTCAPDGPIVGFYKATCVNNVLTVVVRHFLSTQLRVPNGQLLWVGCKVPTTATGTQASGWPNANFWPISFPNLNNTSGGIPNATFPSYIPGPNTTDCNRWRNTGYTTSTDATSIIYRFTRRIIQSPSSCACSAVYWAIFEQGTYTNNNGARVNVC